MVDAASSPPVQPGDVLAGKYRVERVLGVGGMGMVVAARHLQLEELVALKFVLPSALENQAAVERFLREARSAVKLKSAHVARVIDVGSLENGAPYIVMEYLDGSDLSTVLRDRGPLPIETACDYMCQACEALAEAHSLGIIHRDLKPQNLFLARTVGGTTLLKVLDFGISKTLSTDSGPSNLTQTRTAMGSPMYMSPEQMRSSRSVDPRSDVWGLGVVLYELLSGRLPFEADTMPELCLKVTVDPPMQLPTVRAGLPEALVAIVNRCLEKDPAKRYANAADLAQALVQFAPQTARVTAERARLAMSSMTETAIADSQVPPAAPATSSASWAQAKGQTTANDGDKKKQQKGVAIGIAAAVVVLAIVGFGLSRSSSTPPPQPPVGLVQASAAAPPAPSAPPAVDPAPSASQAPTASVPVAVASASAAPPASPNAKPRRGKPAATKPGTAPKGDEDIPSLR